MRKPIAAPRRPARPCRSALRPPPPRPPTTRPCTKAATRTVELGDNFFKPKSMTVRKSTILKFVWGPNNEGTNVEHNVTGVKGNKFDQRRGHDASPTGRYRKRITRNTVDRVHDPPDDDEA